jgi:hypothetical protein
MYVDRHTGWAYEEVLDELRYVRDHLSDGADWEIAHVCAYCMVEVQGKLRKRKEKSVNMWVWPNVDGGVGRLWKKKKKKKKGVRGFKHP